MVPEGKKSVTPSDIHRRLSENLWTECTIESFQDRLFGVQKSTGSPPFTETGMRGLDVHQSVHRDATMKITNKILDFRFSPCTLCCMFSSG